MGCCGSKDDVLPAGDDIVTFDYNPTTGAVVPVRRQLKDHDVSNPREPGTPNGDHRAMVEQSPGNASVVMYSPLDRPKAQSFGSAVPLTDTLTDSFVRPIDGEAWTLTKAQAAYVDGGQNWQTRVNRLAEVEEIKRGEIYGAFLVTSKMLELARRRVKPLYRVRQSVHVDPLASAPTIVIQHEDLSRRSDSLTTQEITEPNELGQSPVFSPTSAEDHSVADTNTQRLQVLDLSGFAIPVGYTSRCSAMGNAWDFLSRPDAGEHLSKGDSYFGFCCKPVRLLDDNDRVQFCAVVNITGFEDELRDNGCPPVDVSNPDQIKSLTLIMVKAMYILPGFELRNISRDLLASIDYQKACQPGGPKFWDDCDEPYTFRETKPLIKYVYSIVIQLRVHEITEPAILNSFAVIDGLRPEKAILLERTKRDKSKSDSTLKCKSVLLYYRISGGTLVCNLTTVVNSSIPRVVASLVNNFGSSGAKEVGETATMTRAFLLEKFGDCR